jgi:hypothetical protein
MLGEKKESGGRRRIQEGRIEQRTDRRRKP